MRRIDPKDVEAALAHDLNNTLQVVMGNLEVLRRRASFVPEIVDAALHAARNAASLADRLVSIGWLRSVEPRSLDLNDALADLNEMIGRVVGTSIRVELQLSAGLGTVRIDPRCLQIALLELATNARDAMPGGGRLTVRSSAAEDGFAKVEIADTGAGMAAERIAGAFEARFGGDSAKPVALGLHLVERCLRSSGGRVEISSAASQGTTVTLYIPSR